MTHQWIVQAQVVVGRLGWTSSVGVPSFILDSGLQGIQNEEHAIQIAKKVVDPQGLAEEVHVSVAPWEPVTGRGTV
jgi:hypothetical protein